ncbi:vimentin-type intermediate filament-associated coiled-coil protein-like [Diadema antillarum]|uniref:vimentin-type intermediate filament-associated coiled-coil protein-like n=1 Tax=Diadema antillarum TaxID=105358 RepID=UPI003A87585E
MFSPTKSSIKEANDHLQALYQRIAELENTVKEQASALMHRDETSQANIREAVRKKGLEIAELHKSMAASEARVQKLLGQNREKDAHIEQLEAKVHFLEDACDSLPALESCVWTLKQAHDLILSTGGVRSRHASAAAASGARSRSASGPASPNCVSSGPGGVLHNNVGMRMDVSTGVTGESGHTGGPTMYSDSGPGRRPAGGPFVNSYNVAVNRSFSISDVEDDEESQSTTV